MRASLMYLVLTSAAVALALAGCPEPPAPDTGEGMPMPPTDTAPGPPTDTGTTAGAWSITSSAFEDGATIPQKYTADGEDVSPPLSFEGAPAGAMEIALICHDPDAPREGGWTHWVVYGMAPEIGGLPEAVPAEERIEEPGLVQGVNSGEKIGYMGPSPPAGPAHRYQFTAYALSEKLDLEPGATKAELEAAMEGKVIGEAMLTGMYGR